MNVIGIIAEYNPFHNGHLYQINEIKKKFKDSIIIVIINGNFTERGDISVINKWDKAKILLNYVDLVIELPTYYGINSADLFSKGSLKILNDLKIDTLVFGTERDDIKDFYKVLECEKSSKFKKLLKEKLEKGNSFVKSYFDTIKDITNIDINTPNDILALSYIREIKNNNYNINAINIKRTNDYHSKDLDEISSASAIRTALKNNIDIKEYVPKDIMKYIQNISLDDYFDLLKYKILITDDLSIYHDVKEGLDIRIKKYINESNTLEELISKVKTKRFTYNRVKRILLYILLDIKEEHFNLYIRPLGFNNNGLKYLNKIKKELTLPLISNYKNNKDLLSFEYKVNSIYSLKSNSNVDDEYNSPINTNES